MIFMNSIVDFVKNKWFCLISFSLLNSVIEKDKQQTVILKILLTFVINLHYNEMHVGNTEC